MHCFPILTRGLVARGLHVTALEPGKSLIALARQNLEGAGDVEFVNAQFEDALLSDLNARPCRSGPARHSTRTRQEPHRTGQAEPGRCWRCGICERSV